MLLPASASPNTPPLPCPTEKRPCGPFCTVSNRLCRRPHCGPCAGRELPIHRPRGRTNPKGREEPNEREIRRVETTARGASYQQRPASVGLERGEQGSYLS